MEPEQREIHELETQIDRKQERLQAKRAYDYLRVRCVRDVDKVRADPYASYQWDGSHGGYYLSVTVHPPLAQTVDEVGQWAGDPKFIEKWQRCCHQLMAKAVDEFLAESRNKWHTQTQEQPQGPPFWGSCLEAGCTRDCFRIAVVAGADWLDTEWAGFVADALKVMTEGMAKWHEEKRNAGQ